MKLKEAWKLSKAPYTELTFRSIELTRGYSQSFGNPVDPGKRVRSILRSAKISKIVFSLFGGIGSLIPFAAFLVHRTPFTLATSIILSLVIGLGYSLLYSFQVLPSFTQAGPYSLLLALPINERDFSLISALSFLRTFDYIVLSGISAQVIAVGFLTGSIFAAIYMLVVAVVNFVFGIALALWLTGAFYRNITRGGRSRLASVGRFVFMITWASMAVFFWFLFDFVSYAVPYISSLLEGNMTHGAGILAIFVHPISEAIGISSIAFGSGAGVPSSILPIVYATTIGYVALAVLVGFRTQRSISIITHGQTPRMIRQATKNFQLKLRQPMFAYIMKDLRVASKSPQAAFIFVLPLFETLFIALGASGLSLFGASSTVTVTSIGTFFTLFAASGLLNTEGVGLEFTMSLPLGARTIVFAKSAVATISFLPVPFAILVLSFLRGGGESIFEIVPFIEIIAVSAATTAQLSFFITTQKRKMYAIAAGTGIKSEGAFTPAGFSVLSGRDMARFAKAMVVGAILLYAPLITYLVSAMHGYSGVLSLAIMICVAGAELAIVRFLLKQSAYR